MKAKAILLIVSMLFMAITAHAQMFQVLRGSMESSQKLQLSLKHDAEKVLTAWKTSTGLSDEQLEVRKQKTRQLLLEESSSFLQADDALLLHLKESGYYALLTEDYEAARKDLKKCLALEGSPDVASKYASMIAVSYLAQKDLTQACQYFELMLDLNNGNSEDLDKSIRNLWEKCCQKW